MHLLTCSICQRVHHLWSARGSPNEYWDLAWNPILGEYVHPSCLEWEILEVERILETSMSPMMNLLGFKTFEDEQDEYNRIQRPHEHGTIQSRREAIALFWREQDRLRYSGTGKDFETSEGHSADSDNHHGKGSPRRLSDKLRRQAEFESDFSLAFSEVVRGAKAGGD